jgi:hypothetical protein
LYLELNRQSRQPRRAACSTAYAHRLVPQHRYRASRKVSERQLRRDTT